MELKKQAPQPPDYKGAAEAQGAASAASTATQTAANRPNQSNAFGANVGWTQGPDGQWHQSQSFGGPMGQAAAGLQQQLFGLGGPMDWSQFGKVQDGSAATDQAYGQAVSRLDPEWQQRETQMRSRLANQGLDPNSEAARGAQRQFDQGRNDAYGSARAQAVGLGDSVFRNNMMARQQAIAEALRARGQPLSELQALQGFLQQPGFIGAGQAAPTNYLNAAGLQWNADLGRWQATNEANADLIGGAAQLGQAAAGLAGA